MAQNQKWPKIKSDPKLKVTQNQNDLDLDHYLELGDISLELDDISIELENIYVLSDLDDLDYFDYF